MGTFTLSNQSLRKIIQQNFFSFNENNLLVFGIRAATPKNLTTCGTFQNEHILESTVLNFENPLCSIGIFNPLENKIAIFPGSTVPWKGYMKKQIQTPRTKISNCIMTGFYSYYEKGTHKAMSPNAHEALRLKTNVFIRRSLDDLKFDNSDTIDVSNPNDNIHAAFCENVNGVYSSAGCQVIVGLPKCANRNYKDNTAFWKKFHDYIYSSPQSRFDYMLVRGEDAAKVAELMNSGTLTPRLRFGSKGFLVKQLQEKLKEAGFYNSIIDGDFSKDTLLSVYEFQKKQFGMNEADCVVGPKTAQKLSITFPNL